jgi:hypothetical protein
MSRDAVTATVAIDPRNPLRLEASRVSRAVFDMLAVRPSLGRLFLADDEGASAAPVA